MADHKDRLDQPAKHIQFYVYKMIDDDSLFTSYTGNTSDAGECRFTLHATGIYVIKFAMPFADEYFEFGTRYFKVETLGTTIDLGTIYLLSTGSISGMIYINADIHDTLRVNGRWKGEGLGNYICSSTKCTRNDSTFLLYQTEQVIPPGRYSVQITVQADSWQGQNTGHQFGALVDTVVEIARNQAVILPTIPLYTTLSVSQQQQHVVDSLAVLTMCEIYGRSYWSYFNSRTGRLEYLALHVMGGISWQDLKSRLSVLSGLRGLVISGATGDTLPVEICRMKNLDVLQLDSCELSVLPEEFENLDNLLLLQLAKNKFNTLPPILLDSRWAPLDCYVYLAGNPIILDPATENLLGSGIFVQNGNQTYTMNKHFPDLLTEILAADLAIMKKFCEVNQIPIVAMPELYYASHGRIVFIKIPERYCIDTIPPAIAGLDKLQSLVIKRNSIDTIPAVLASCKDLSELEIMNGTVRFIAPEIGTMPNLRKLNVCNNELTAVPDLIHTLYLNSRASSRQFKADFSANLLVPNDPDTYAQWNCFTMYQKEVAAGFNQDFMIDMQNFENIWTIKDYAGGFLGGNRFMGNHLVSLEVSLNIWGLGGMPPILTLFDSLKSIGLFGPSNYENHIEVLRFEGDENWIEKYLTVEDILISNLPGVDTLPDGFFAHFPKVKRISLRGCDFTHVPGVLKRLPDLESVDMYWNKLRDLSAEDQTWLDTYCRELPSAISFGFPFEGYAGQPWNQCQRPIN